jgi:hypothetical protein
MLNEVYSRAESHHPADDRGVMQIPAVVTDRPPLTVGIHLYIALSGGAVHAHEHVTGVKVHRVGRRHS